MTILLEQVINWCDRQGAHNPLGFLVTFATGTIMIIFIIIVIDQNKIGYPKKICELWNIIHECMR